MQLPDNLFSDPYYTEGRMNNAGITDEDYRNMARDSRPVTKAPELGMDYAKCPVPGVIAKDTKPTNPKDAAATTRLDLSLFPATARAYGALAMTEGDLKYGAYNYREAGVQASIYYAAAGRHLDKWYNGEECDPKTRVPHLASAIACIAVLIDGIEKANWTDDRPPTTNLGPLLDSFEEKVAHLQKIFPRRSARYTAKR